MGAKEYNKKNYEGAFEGFKNALTVEEFTRGKAYEYNGYRFPVLDTSLIQNTAMAAYQAKDTASGIGFYRKIIDAGVAGDAFLPIYETVAEYYMKKKDLANMNGIIDKGRSVFPKDEFWTEMEVEYVSKNGNKEDLYAKYDELMKRYPTEYKWPYNLSVELFNELYTGDAKPANALAMKAKLTEALKNAISIQGDKAVEARMLMTRHTYNDAYDYQDSSKKFKGVKPEDVKKRNDAKAYFIKKIDECIPYAESVITFYYAQPSLKPVQKANLKIVLDILSQLYSAKGDAKKAAEYDKKKADAEKL